MLQSNRNKDAHTLHLSKNVLLSPTILTVIVSLKYHSLWHNTRKMSHMLSNDILFTCQSVIFGHFYIRLSMSNKYMIMMKKWHRGWCVPFFSFKLNGRTSWNCESPFLWGDDKILFISGCGGHMIKRSVRLFCVCIVLLIWVKI